MKLDKSKTTIIGAVVLIVACVGSFMGVRALNNKTTMVVPSSIYTTASTSQTTTVSATASSADLVTDGSTTVDSRVPTTMPLATRGDSANNSNNTAAANEQISAGDSTSSSSNNLFTTFADVSSSATTTTKIPASTITTKATTQATTKVSQTTSEAASEVIKNAAVFSDGFLSYKFNPDGDFYYTNDDPWQRNFGFNEAYDIAAPFVIMYYDTMRCKFDYAGKNWMVQFWKGQYGFVFIGGEIGVYTKPADRTVEHYDCASDEDALKMSMTLYRDGKEQLTRNYGTYWWCTGFVPGKLDKFSDRSELEIKCRITMKDYKMLLAFSGALKENGLNINENFTTSGLDVFVTW